MLWVHQQGKAELKAAILQEPEVRQFIDTSASVFNNAISTAIESVSISPLMASRLRDSNYVFSGIKTFHQLNEAFPKLLDESGAVRPFNEFKKDVLSIHETYNVRYLRTEYSFAVASSQMAGRWENFVKDGDRYNLQYRTAGDERVRESHKLINRVTLPVTSKFWDKYFPPNGWGCRCTIVQVLKSQYPETNEPEAMNDASQATEGRHREMFEFNPGKKQTTFPYYNSYTIRQCSSCKTRKDLKLAAPIPNNQLCAACKVVMRMTEDWKRKKEMSPKEAEKRVKEWMSKHESSRMVKSKKIATGEIRMNSDAIKRFVRHSKSSEGKWILTTLSDNAGRMKKISYSQLGEGKDISDEATKKNLQEKGRRHVEGYYRYEYQYNGVTWIIGTEKIKKGKTAYEQPYFISKKKS